MIFFDDIERDRVQLMLSQHALSAASGIAWRTYARLIKKPHGGKGEVLDRLAATIAELRRRRQDDLREMAQARKMRA